jgi:hypothetical protein
MGLPYMKQIAGGWESNIPVENARELEAVKEARGTGKRYSSRHFLH